MILFLFLEKSSQKNHKWEVRLTPYFPFCSQVFLLRSYFPEMVIPSKAM